MSRLNGDLLSERQPRRGGRQIKDYAGNKGTTILKGFNGEYSYSLGKGRKLGGSEGWRDGK